MGTSSTTRPPRRAQRGLSESLQWAMLFPVAVLAVLGVIQTGLWLHARDIAAASALAGAEAEALYGAAPGVGADLARRMAEDSGLHDVEVRVVRSSNRVHVAVVGRCDGFVSGGLRTVRSEATQPLEGS